MATSALIEKIYQRFKEVFPDSRYNPELVEEQLAAGDILSGRREVLPYLQSALLDEKVVELQVDRLPRVFYTRLEDDPPPEQEEEEYKENSYLEDLTHVLILPVEPGIGNYNLRNSRYLVLRISTSLYSVEAVAEFRGLSKREEQSFFRISFPTMARIVRDAREFRAKVPRSMRLEAAILASRQRPQIDGEVLDISAKGVTFSVSRGEQKSLTVGDPLMVKVYLEDKMLFRVGGWIRDLTKMRVNGGMDFTCGMKFDLENQIVAGSVESLVAQVQRIHLQELAGLSEQYGVQLHV